MEKEADCAAVAFPNSNPQSPAISPIIDVWDHNFLPEIKRISSIIKQYPFISFDTEFPGLVSDCGDASLNNTFFTYEVIKRSVEQTNLIQVGITLSDSEGQSPSDTSTWQFHLKYDLNKEQHAAVSIELLKEAGIDFAKHKVSGINPLVFAEYLITSGLVLVEDVQWICFHGLFDFAYLLRLLTGEAFLPADEYSFQDTLQLYFPQVFDVKNMAGPWSHLQGSLSKLCQELGIRRVGIQHQAGSDSLVTAAAFFKLRDRYYNTKNGLTEVRNTLFGINIDEAWDKAPYIYDEGYRRGFEWYNPCIPAYVNAKWLPIKQEEGKREGRFGRDMSMCIQTEAN